ncbi:MAG: integrase [Bacteroidetes bacterium]|nr:MAG: integrase [Bacteroidota bacterium]
MKDSAKADYLISYYLDKRSVKKNGSHPVKLQVYNVQTQTRKRYGTKFSFTEKEFESVWLTVKPRKEYKETRKELNALETQANKVADKITPFSFEVFERLFVGKSSTKTMDVNYYYETAIAQFKKMGQTSNANNYGLALKSLLNYHKKDSINFSDVTVNWLKGYERNMVEVKERSKTTVSIYLRTLRTVFNNAISDKVISNEIYPFGKRKYSVPNPKGVKKALTDIELKALFEGEPSTIEQEKAKAFWFFSFVCNGINFADILNLKWKDVNKESITFYRQKTTSTNKNEKPITVYLNDFSQNVIDEYGNENRNPQAFVFDVIDPKADPETKQKQRKNFTRFVNQHIKKYSKSLGLSDDISTYWARHSFATKAIRNGASIEFVGEALAHTNIKTTIGYFAGFENDQKKAIADNMLKFD